MKLMLLIFSLFSFSAHLKAQDITQFDFPFLLGDWYWFNPALSETEDKNGYRAISLRFSSDYRFSLKMLDVNGHIHETRGSYDLDETTLLLLDDSGDTQYQSYSLNHHQLMLKGTRFTKMLSQDISGAWYSEFISGKDVDERVNEMVLMLRPDFLFLVRITGTEGQSVTHQGIYFLENNHLVLLYREGQEDTLFELDENKLALSNAHFDMEAVLRRRLE